jgi:hypothetical protein
MITGATLSAINPNSGPGTVRPYVLWDVTTSQASLHAGDTGSAAGIAIYGDLGSGTTFGSVLPASLSTSPIVVPFNAAGIAALNAARGGPMSIGGDLQGAVGPDDYMFTDTEFATSVSLPLTIAGPAHQPDALIRGGLASAYLGDDIYNQTGARQTFVRQVRPGFGDQFNMRIENDGSLEDSFSVHGAGSSMKFKVSYWYGATDVTSEVVAGTFRTPNLKPGASVHLMAFIYARRGTRSGASMTDLIAVTSVGPTEERTNGIVHAMDVVGARLVVNKKAGDLNSQLPIP